MGLSNAIKKALLDAYFGKAALSAPANVYIGLSKSAPADDGTNINEPSGGGYARVQVANSAGSFSGASNADPSVTSNANAITFPASTAAWAAGVDLTHFVIFTAASGGSYIGGGALNTARKVTAAGVTLKFEANQLTISMD